MIFLIVSFAASTIGAVCGIGGGVVIKPALDMFGLESVSVISFLSGCTVLCMSFVTVTGSLISGEKKVSASTGTLLALGAVAGGIAGKQIFSAAIAFFDDQNAVGFVQAVCLAVITAGTLIYTLLKNRIRSHKISAAPVCVVIGLGLGMISAFLGIGGGPINLAVLYFFFGMDAKTAAANSLYIILFSQAASLVTTIITGSVPSFPWYELALMAAGGVAGGFIGRALNKKIDNLGVERLFAGLMVVIICVSVFNAFGYAMK